MITHLLACHQLQTRLKFAFITALTILRHNDRMFSHQVASIHDASEHRASSQAEGRGMLGKIVCSKFSFGNDPTIVLEALLMLGGIRRGVESSTCL